MTDPTIPYDSGNVTPPPERPGWPPADALPSTDAGSHTLPGSNGSSDSSRSSESSGPSGAKQTAEAAKEQAGAVKDTAVDAARDVAGTAKDQAGDVLGEVRQQSRQLLSQTTSELSSQASTQQSRIAGGIGEYAGQLRSMADNAEQSGVVADLVHQVANRGERAAAYLSDREPSDLLEDVKDFARRRPVAFLGIAVGAGILVGRLGRGLFADARGGDPMVSSGRRNDEPARRSAALEEVPTSGTGAGLSYGNPIADPAAGAAGGPLEPTFGVPGAASQPPEYGNVTDTATGTIGPGTQTLGEPVDRDLDR